MQRKFLKGFIALLTFCFIFTSINPGQILAQTIDKDGSQTPQSIETFSSENSIFPSSEELILEDNHLEEEIDMEAEDNLGSTDEIDSVIQPLALPAYVIPAVIKGFQIGSKWYAKKYDKNYPTTGKTTNATLRNGSLSGTVHSVTKVAFKEGFPVFKHAASVTLPYRLLKSTNATQFKHANAELKSKVLNDRFVFNKFTADQIQDIMDGKTPDGYIWHHHQNPGVLQLVDEYEHEKTGHTGGKSLWGS